MKIVLISSSYHPYYRGGGEHSVKVLAENLQQRGHEVRVITAYERAQTDRVAGVTVHRIRHPNIYWSYHSSGKAVGQKLIWHALEGYNPRVSASVAPLLAEFRPDVLHVRNVEDFSPYVAKVAHQRGIPVVVTLNSYTWLCPRATMFRHGHNCPRQCRDCQLITYPKKRLSRYVDAVVGVSQFMIDRHQQYHYFPDAQPSAVYTSVEPHPLPLPAEQNGFVTFGYLGRIHPTKGVYQIIEAFLSLPSDHRYRLLIAGEGPDEYIRQCQQRAANHHHIVFLGKYPASDFYSKVDVVIINSLWNEPFPRVLVEAYGYGRPVIAANTGGTPEMVVDGLTGYTFAPSDHHQLSQLVRLFGQMSLMQLQSIQNQVIIFSKEQFASEVGEYLRIYRSLVRTDQ